MTTDTCLELTLPAVPTSVRKARNAVGETVARMAAGERLVGDVRLCVSEAVSNVVRHAYGSRRGDVKIVVEREDEELSVVVRDEGKGIGRASRRERMGGYGLKIIENVARRHRVTSRRDAGTEVQMVFELASRSQRPAKTSVSVV